MAKSLDVKQLSTEATLSIQKLGLNFKLGPKH